MRERMMAAVTVVGSYNRDLLLRTSKLPRAGETLMGTFATAHGGKGFNQAMACCRLGADTQFLGALGSDSAAADARQFAADQQLSCQWETHAGPTGTAAVICDAAGENLIVVAPGANNLLSTDHLQAHSRCIADCDVLLVQLECHLTTVEFALQSGRRHGACNILNPAPMNPDLDSHLLQWADLATPNETEFEGLCTILGVILPAQWQRLADADLHDLCRTAGMPDLVITMGAAGGFFSSRNDRFGRYAAPPVTAVDTIGAGDAFNGALAVALASGRPLPEALPLAAAAAAVAVTRPGAAEAMPDRREAGWPELAD